MIRDVFGINIENVNNDSLVVLEFNGCESFSYHDFIDQACHGFCYEIKFAQRLDKMNPALLLNADNTIDQNALLTISHSDHKTTYVHGIISSFIDHGINCTKDSLNIRYNYYTILLVPCIERLALRHNSRIFQEQTTPEIITTILTEMGIIHFNFNLSRQYYPRKYCTQYRESDLSFVERIAAEEGIIYCIQHEQDKHTIIFIDQVSLTYDLDETIEHLPYDHNLSDQSFISALNIERKQNIELVNLSEHCFTKPVYRFNHTAQLSTHNIPLYTYNDHPARTKDDTRGKIFATIRLEYLNRTSYMAHAKSNHILLRPGFQFKLHHNLQCELENNWYIVAATYHGQQPQALEELNDASSCINYYNKLTMLPANRNWQAIPTIKPQIDGPMIATVVGPSGEEIYCDKYGRVKVKFAWDKLNVNQHDTSCWIRVAQAWSGANYGTMLTPRVGDEVIVNFLHGDIDQPIITGSLYNAINMPSYKLPHYKTKTVLRTSSYKSVGFNELSFDDATNNEKVYLKAQKDLDTLVLNNHQTVVYNNYNISVGNDLSELIAGNKTTQIFKDSRQKVKGSYTLEALGSIKNLTRDRITNSALINDTYSLYRSSNRGSYELSLGAGHQMIMASDHNIVINAKKAITLRVGDCFVHIDHEGVHIKGRKINLNSGTNATIAARVLSAPTIIQNILMNDDGGITEYWEQITTLKRQLNFAENSHLPLIVPPDLDEQSAPAAEPLTTDTDTPDTTSSSQTSNELNMDI